MIQISLQNPKPKETESHQKKKTNEALKKIMTLLKDP
jgi:hypothetical protein